MFSEPSKPSEVVIFETAELMELQMARNLIEQEGIPCRVIGGGASSLLGALLGPQMTGFHQLLVPADLEERATQTLEAAWRGRASEAADDVLLSRR